MNTSQYIFALCYTAVMRSVWAGHEVCKITENVIRQAQTLQETIIISSTGFQDKYDSVLGKMKNEESQE